MKDKQLNELLGSLKDLIFFCRKIGYPMVSGDSKQTIESMQATLRKVETKLALYQLALKNETKAATRARLDKLILQAEKPPASANGLDKEKLLNYAQMCRLDSNAYMQLVEAIERGEFDIEPGDAE